jgi:two-component system, OmpR family, sensor histidine kinase KdpD
MEWPTGSRSRDVVAIAATIGLPLAATLVASGVDLGPFGPPSLYLLAVVLAAAVGGNRSGLAAAALSFLGLNYYFTEPHHTLRVDKTADVVALLVFLVVAVVVGTLLARALAERQRAERQ